MNPVTQVEAGKYRILSHVIEGVEHLLVVKRGADIKLMFIPTEVRTVRSADNMLEIKEARGFKVPLARPLANAIECAEIDSYTPKALIRWA